MGTPLVSVVTPSYNRPNHIRTAVETVSRQTYPNVEHVIVDDHSETPVRNVVDKRDSVRVVRHDDNRGANAARNTGIKVADGKFVAFLDDDDEWHPSKLQKQVKVAKETNAGAVYSGRLRLTENKSICPDKAGNVTKSLLGGNFIGTFSTFMVKCDVIDMVGYPDESLPSWQDWDYYLRVSQETAVQPVQEPLSFRVDRGQQQISDNHPEKKDVTVPQFREKHGNLASKYGCEDEFEAAIANDLGWSATRAGNYSEARRYFVDAFCTSPSAHSLLSLALIMGNSYTFKLGTELFNLINRMRNKSSPVQP